MNEHKAVPNIRFKDFEDEWAEKKISNFIIKNSDKNKNLVIKNIESISNKTGFTKQSEQFDGYRVASQDISNYYVISPNQFAYNPSRINVGSIAYKNKGEDKSIISPLYISFSTSSHINDHFLWFWFKTTSFKKQRIQFSEGGVRDTLPFENLKKMEISFPLIQEQQKIGYLFAKLDKLLDLQQQKIDKLELLKKALLQKLFPKHDTKIPELRFKGFEGDWNQDKAINIFKNVSDKNHPELPVLSASQEDGMVLRRDINIDIKYKNSSLTTYKKVEPGQFVIHLRSFQGGFAYSTFEGITSPAYTILAFIKKENHYKLFWKQIFLSGNFIRRLKTITYGVRDGKSISYNDFGSLNICFPFIKEQQKIGNLLSKDDQLIELENKKLQNFQQVKKCLLQNMFVD